jgi:PPOX class probable F420-dependent enzyme
MDKLTADAVQLLRGKNLAHVATVNEDGSPHVAPMWVDVDPDRDLILLNTADGRRKVENVRRDPRIAISAVYGDRPHPPLIVRGVVERITTEGGLEHIDFLSRKYDDEPWVPKEGQVRLILEVRPDLVDFPLT